MTKTALVQAEHMYNTWLYDLDVFNQELGVLDHHLSGVREKAIVAGRADQWDGIDMRIATRQEHIDQLIHRLNDNVQEVNMHAQKDGSWYIENQLHNKYLQLSKDFLEEQQALQQLKQDFHKFSNSL